MKKPDSNSFSPEGAMQSKSLKENVDVTISDDLKDLKIADGSDGKIMADSEASAGNTNGADSEASAGNTNGADFEGNMPYRRRKLKSRQPSRNKEAVSSESLNIGEKKTGGSDGKIIANPEASAGNTKGADSEANMPYRRRRRKPN